MGDAGLRDALLRLGRAVRTGRGADREAQHKTGNKTGRESG
jgi:hypothetical protein